MKRIWSGSKAFDCNQHKQDYNQGGKVGKDEVFAYASFFKWTFSSFLCGQVETREKEAAMLG